MKSGMKCITTGLFKIFILTLSWGSLQAQVLKNLPQLGKDPVKEVIEAMTLAEKVNLVGGMERSAGGRTRFQRDRFVVAG